MLMKGRIYSYQNTISKNSDDPVTVEGQGLHIAYIPKDIRKVTDSFQTDKNNQNSLWSQAMFYSFNATNDISFDMKKHFPLKTRIEEQEKTHRFAMVDLNATGSSQSL